MYLIFILKPHVCCNLAQLDLDAIQTFLDTRQSEQGIIVAVPLFT